MPGQQIVDSLRFTQRDLEQIVAELNRDRAGGPAVARREARRWACQFQRAVLTTFERQGSKKHHAVVPRNISINGLAVLHGGYVHIGTTCALTLRGVDGSARTIHGTVCRCQHFRAHLHDVGIRFESALSPRDFFITFGNEYLFQAEHVDPKTLSGRLAVVEPNVSEQQLIAHLCRSSDLTLECARTAEEGLALLATGPDFALVDHALDGVDGLQFLASCRERGIDVPIVLMAAGHDRDLRYAAIAAGARELVFKPILGDIVLRAAAEFLLLGPEVDEPGATSDSTDQRLSTDAVEMHRQELTELGVRIRTSLEALEFAAVRAACEQISGTSAAFGFAAQAEQARTIVAGMEKDHPADKLKGDIERLLVLIDRARTSAPSTRAA